MCVIFIVVDPYYLERNGLYIGQGTAMMSRAGMFRALEGIAVDMSNRVFKLPSFRGIVNSLSMFDTYNNMFLAWMIQCGILFLF